jgi:hypothetical protein
MMRMDYYQGVVTEYLRADRAMFVNVECCVQLNEAPNPDSSGPHWYCDAVAVNFRESMVYLCEISYSKTLDALVKRLKSWSKEWLSLRAAIVRDCHLPPAWTVRPWLFIPGDRRAMLDRKLATGVYGSGEPTAMPKVRITNLEDVAPWKYHSWNHVLECGE